VHGLQGKNPNYNYKLDLNEKNIYVQYHLQTKRHTFYEMDR